MRFILFRRLTIFGRRWFWSLKASNGEIVAQSEGYHTRQGALNGIRAVKGCFDAPIEETR